MTPEEQAQILAGQVPATVQGQPTEASEQRRIIDPRVDPEQVYATPAWRTEPTTDYDPRKGR